jgi:colanic acid biosynthesis glycosyl transferase WcaI
MTRRARLLIYTANYWPEPTGFAPMTTDLAETLAASDWDVTVLTGLPMAPRWRVYDDYRSRLVMREQHNGVTVLRARQYVPERPSDGLMPTWKRIAFDTSLVTSCLPVAWRARRPDVIVALGPPLQVGWASTVLGVVWGAPVLYWLQDIVPDAALNVGMLRNQRVIRWARRFEKSLYRSVDRIGIISKGFERNLLAKGVEPGKLALLPNWADLRRFENLSMLDGAQTRRELDIAPNDTVILHAGSVSAKQRLENLIRGMKLLEGDRTVRLLVAGDGTCLESAKREVQNLGLANVTFLSTVVGTRYVDLLRAADIHVVNQAGEIVDALIPSKLLTYLPSERPVVAAVHGDSETSHFVTASGCGIVVPPDSPMELAAALRNLIEQPERRRQLGLAGADYVRQHLDRKVIIERFRTTLLTMLGDRGLSAPTANAVSVNP